MTHPPRTTRRGAAVGACVLLLSATACSSDADSTAAETLPEVAAGATAGSTDAPTTQAPSTDTTTDDTTAPARSDNTSGESTISEPAVVPEALQFTAPLVGGGTFDGAAAVGRPTVFWFWAPT